MDMYHSLFLVVQFFAFSLLPSDIVKALENKNEPAEKVESRLSPVVINNKITFFLVPKSARGAEERWHLRGGSACCVDDECNMCKHDLNQGVVVISDRAGLSEGSEG